MPRKQVAVLVGLAITALLGMNACIGTQKSSNTNTTSTTASASPAASTTKSSSAAPVDPKPGDPAPGEASGSYTAKGETIELKYAYATRGKRFGNDSIIVLVTDKPIPPESVAEELQDQTLLLAEKIRGLEYVFDANKEGYWVRFHPSQYQESKSASSFDLKVEGNTVRGSDNDQGELNDGKYKRSLKFAANISQ
jgi:hypothetical protein